MGDAGIAANVHGHHGSVLETNSLIVRDAGAGRTDAGANGNNTLISKTLGKDMREYRKSLLVRYNSL